jgi:hypothetical protein
MVTQLGKTNLVILAFLVLMVPGLLHSATQQPKAATIAYPPLILSGAGALDCTISAKANGRQILKIESGSGIPFDAEVTPILDGVVELKSAGLNYRFTSNLSKPIATHVPGFGDVTILEMKTLVSVNVSKYKQPNGPGTKITFDSTDMNSKDVYVEFRGILKQALTDKKYAFRTIMGPAADGSGSVVPENSNTISKLLEKHVMVINRPSPDKPFSQITTSLQEIP